MDFYYFFYKSLSLSLVFFLLLHAGAVTVSKAQSESGTCAFQMAWETQSLPQRALLIHAPCLFWTDRTDKA